MNTNIAVLILFFEKTQQTINCIKSFAKETIGVNIHVLNNGSSMKNWEYLKRNTSHFSNIHFHHSAFNLGPSKGRNHLISNTNEEWLFLVDNDITIKEKGTWYDIISLYIQRHPESKIICPKLFNVYEGGYCHHPKIKIEDGNITFLNNTLPGPTNYFPSGATLIHRTIFENIGLFDNELFAFEDYEFAIRALHLGQDLIVDFCDKITLIHDHKYSNNQADKKAVFERYNNERLRKSFERIESKLDVKFSHEWESWTDSQIFEMTKMNFVRRQIRKIQRKFYK